MQRLGLLFAIFGVSLLVPAFAYEPAIDFRGVDEALTSEPTKVMVLGSSHLAQHDGLTPDDVTPLIDRLVTFAPQVITIEAMPGEVCEMMRTYSSEYQAAIQKYCPPVEDYRTDSGMTAAQAANYIRTSLTDWPENPLSSDRRKLAAAFLASGEPYSALVQWWHLSEAERKQGDGLGARSVKALQKYANSMNENASIAARLAVQLGLQRVYTSDDHSSDLVLANHGGALWARMGEIWSSGPSALREAYGDAVKQITEGEILAAYQFFNDPKTQRLSIDGDFRRAIADDQVEQYGRIYNSWYQVRNLRMVSSVVAATANQPGARVLALVGASHKAYFEALLNMMHDIEIVSTDTVLK